MIPAPVDDTERDLHQTDALRHARIEHSQVLSKGHHQVGEVRVAVGTECLLGRHDVSYDPLSARRILQLEQRAPDVRELGLRLGSRFERAARLAALEVQPDVAVDVAGESDSSRRGGRERNRQ